MQKKNIFLRKKEKLSLSVRLNQALDGGTFPGYNKLMCLVINKLFSTEENGLAIPLD